MFFGFGQNDHNCSNWFCQVAISPPMNFGMPIPLPRREKGERLQKAVIHRLHNDRQKKAPWKAAAGAGASAGAWQSSFSVSQRRSSPRTRRLCSLAHRLRVPPGLSPAHSPTLSHRHLDKVLFPPKLPLVFAPAASVEKPPKTTGNEGFLKIIAPQKQEGTHGFGFPALCFFFAGLADCKYAIRKPEDRANLSFKNEVNIESILRGDGPESIRSSTLKMQNHRNNRFRLRGTSNWSSWVFF